MKPLLYLTFRQFKNAVIRNLSSPKRLIGLLFFGLYYFGFFIRPAFSGRISRPLPMGPEGGLLEFPPMDVLEAIVFTILAFLSLFMFLSAAANQTAFKPADVDMLFPTPVKPRVVLVFRLIRDYLFTLIFPFIIVLFGLYPAKMGWESLFRNFPNEAYGGMAIRALSVGWILIALTWVSINYATGLFINRSDRQSDRNKSILFWGIGAATVALGIYIFLNARDAKSVADWIALSKAPFVRIFFLPSTLATYLVMSPLYANWLLGAAGLGGLLLLVGLPLWLAMSQADWMYDQAAARGFGSMQMRDMQRKGDLLGMVAERARQGKVKVKTGSWVHRLHVSGPAALLWKEHFMQVRGMTGVLVGLVIQCVMMTVLPFIIPKSNKGDMPAEVMLLLMQAVGVMSITLPLAQVGFIEVLRRVDLLKPLPFKSITMSIWEVAGRSFLSVLTSIIGAAGAVALTPSVWKAALAAVILAPGLSFLLSATVFLMTVTFPDFDDLTQRQFRGIVTMLAIALFGLIPALVFLVPWLGMKWPPYISAVAASALALGMGVVVCAMAGKSYESYNPSE